MIDYRSAEDLATGTLVCAGVPDDNARRTAQLLATADAWGISSHGLLRLPRYLSRLAKGGQVPAATLEIVRDTGTVVAFDGHDGLGHWQLWHAAEEAADRAQRLGVGIASVGTSSHCGALGLYVAPALRRGLVALVFSTGPAVMAPPGAGRAQLSTSPLAAGIPTGDRWAVVDLATSAVARGRIAAAARRGDPLPDGWAVDASGRPTRDAAAALEGMLAPMGGPKGFAIAYLVEALTAASVGPSLAVDAADMLDPHQDDRPQRLAHLVVAIDPAAVDVDGHGAERRAELASNIVTAGGRVPGASRILPGDVPADQPLDIAEDLIDEITAWLDGPGRTAAAESTTGPTR